MKKSGLVALMIGVLVWTVGCTGYRYHTQTGAAVGAGVGALAGQAIGHDTESTLIGTALGGLAGAVVGDAIDKNNAQPYYNYKYGNPSTSYYNYKYGPSTSYSSYSSYYNTSNGRWVYVPGRWVNGQWVPARQVWVPQGTPRR